MVSIIILNWNGVRDTICCLNSLKRTKYSNYEVIVVDNGSLRDEAKILKDRFRNYASIFRLERNLGFAGGNNLAFKKARGKYIVLLNNDTVVDKNWLGSVVETFESDESIAIIQPKIRLYSKKDYFDYAGAAGGFIDRFGYPFTRGRIFSTLEKDLGQYDFKCPIFWASGAAICIRRSIIYITRYLFDENFFNYMEEIDFCWRVQNLGFKIIFIPDSVVYHKVAASAKKNLLKKRYYEHRNNLILLLKNLPDKLLVKSLTARFFLELITYFYYLLTGKFTFLLALFYAHVDFLRILPFYIGKKNLRSSISFENYVYPKSIVLSYFLFRKRYFWQLKFDSVGERTDPNVVWMLPTFFQHQKVYEFCKRLAKGKTVLELGCGSGLGAFEISKVAKEVLAVDIHSQSIAKAKEIYQRRNLKFECFDVTKFKTSKKFDLVVSFQVIEHLEKPEDFLLNVKSLMKKKGFFLLSTPNRLTQSFNENPYHIREYSKKELEEILSRFFSKVFFYGLHGSPRAKKYENDRRKKVLEVLRLDFLKIRNILPRRIKIFFFEFFVRLVRLGIYSATPRKVLEICKEDFFIKKLNVDESLDLIAICRY